MTIKEKNNITHKELLTFSNLTNLEWEFVNLDTTDYGEGVKAAKSTQLNDLLAPENFVRIRKGENGEDIREQVYGEREEGLQEMRKDAGIAMEYLEKLDTGNSEGDFLKEWEVVFGADKYKIMEDYLNLRWEPIHQILTEYLNELEAQEKRSNIKEEKESIQKEKKELEDFLEKKPYPSREELTPEYQAKIKLQVGIGEVR